MSNSNSKLPILEKGQSLFEVLFSIAIISIILIALVSLVAGSVRNSDFSQNNALRPLGDWFQRVLVRFREHPLVEN